MNVLTWNATAMFLPKPYNIRSKVHARRESTDGQQFMTPCDCRTSQNVSLYGAKLFCCKCSAAGHKPFDILMIIFSVGTLVKESNEGSNKLCDPVTPVAL